MQHKLHVCIQAFIAGNEPSAIRLTKGRYQGRTAVVLPWFALADSHLRNPFDFVRDVAGLREVGYLTDQRGWAERINAPRQTQRMKSWIELDIASGDILASAHVASPTVEIDIPSGDVTGEQTADLERDLFGGRRSSWTRVMSTPRVAGQSHNEFCYRLEARGSDPLVVGSRLRPIYYSGDLTVSVSPHSGRSGVGYVDLHFSGDATIFPYFEGLARLGADTEILFRAPPPAGATVESLIWGSRSGRLHGRCRLPLMDWAERELVF